MGERALFRDIPHEHGDCAPDRLIDVNDEDFVVVSQENRAAAAGRQDRPHLHFDHRFVHPAQTVAVRSRKTSGSGSLDDREIFAMRACMSAAVIQYALCGRRCAQKNEDRVGC